MERLTYERVRTRDAAARMLHAWFEHCADPGVPELPIDWHAPQPHRSEAGYHA